MSSEGLSVMSGAAAVVAASTLSDDDEDVEKDKKKNKEEEEQEEGEKEEAAGGACGVGEVVVVSSLNNFDVVLMEEEDKDKCCLLALPTQGMYAGHVGNQRFRVLLDMNRTAFHELYERGQDTSSVVQKLWSVVVEQCVPAGRFLQPQKQQEQQQQQASETEKEKSWTLVPKRLVEEFMERALKPRVNNNNYEEQSNPCNDAPRRRVSFFNSMNPAVDDSSTPAEGLHEQEEKKRRRRSSLLRRSLSDSIQSSFVKSLEEKKKLNRTTEERRPSLFRLFRKFKTVPQPDPLDIVLAFEDIMVNDDDYGNYDNEETCEFTTDTVGNNRLKVLMQLQTENYLTSTIDQQAKIIQEWIRTVTRHWKARFLRKLNDELFEVMDDGAVERALDQIMQKQKQQQMQQQRNSNNTPSPWNDDTSSLTFQPDQGSGFLRSDEFSIGNASAEFSVSSAPLPLGNTSSMASSQPTPPPRRGKNLFPFSRAASDTGLLTTSSKQQQQQQRGTSDSRLQTERRESIMTTDTSTNSKLPEPSVGLLENDHDLRSAAVQSLQRRKKRQSLATRLQKMAQQTSTSVRGGFFGSASNASVASSSNYSPPTQPPRAVQVQGRRTSVMSTLTDESQNNNTTEAQGHARMPFFISTSFRRLSGSSMSTTGSNSVQQYAAHIMDISARSSMEISARSTLSNTHLQENHYNYHNNNNNNNNDPRRSITLTSVQEETDSMGGGGGKLAHQQQQRSVNSQPPYNSMQRLLQQQQLQQCHNNNPHKCQDSSCADSKSSRSGISSEFAEFAHLLQDTLLPSPRTSLDGTTTIQSKSSSGAMTMLVNHQ